jgi:Heterokaryon incompatibility protein (HET)
MDYVDCLSTLSKYVYTLFLDLVITMRLLEARTLQVKSFNDQSKTPKYAILSHTWGEDEVEYHEMISSPEEAKRKPKFDKVRHSAQQAIADGFDYLWVDTCCIDKSSSAELSEAINSMFLWYKRAQVCYVHLADVTTQLLDGWKDGEDDISPWTATFVGCRWFTRGWTLQELIAPRRLVFYTKDWRRIATKRELCQTIARHIGIPSPVLLGADPRRELVAERMSWASKRSTSRIEDMAYCLMGLFDVNMPLLYGEGERAFLRLQQELIKFNNDRSLFCWAAKEASPTTFRGLLARSPAEFESFCEYELGSIYGRFEINQSGLEIALPLKPIPSDDDEFYAIVVESGSRWLMIRLRQISEDLYARVDPNELLRVWNDDYNILSENKRQKSKLITVPHTFESFRYDAYLNYRIGGVYLEYYPTDLSIVEIEPSGIWDDETNVLPLDFSENLSPLEGVSITFSPVGKPDFTWKIDIIDQLRSESEFIYRMVDGNIGYVAYISQGFVGDKMMIIIKINYMGYLKDEGEQ